MSSATESLGNAQRGLVSTAQADRQPIRIFGDERGDGSTLLLQIARPVPLQLVHQVESDQREILRLARCQNSLQVCPRDRDS